MSTQKPALIAYTVKSRGKGQTAIWSKVGAAWPHSGGNGFSIELESFPVNGRLVLIESKAESEAGTAGEAAA